MFHMSWIIRITFHYLGWQPCMMLLLRCHWKIFTRIVLIYTLIIQFWFIFINFELNFKILSLLCFMSVNVLPACLHCIMWMQCQQRLEERARSPGTRVNSRLCLALWMLGTEPQCCARADSTLNCWAASSASHSGVLYLHLQVARLMDGDLLVQTECGAVAPGYRTA